MYEVRGAVSDDHAHCAACAPKRFKGKSDTDVEYIFAGYMTAHVFTQPFRTEKPDSIRVCQVLVLPAYQGRGLGTVLLNSIYDVALAENMYEVTVEDPAPGFTRVRSRSCFGDPCVSFTPACIAYPTHSFGMSSMSHDAGIPAYSRSSCASSSPTTRSLRRRPNQYVCVCVCVCGRLCGCGWLVLWVCSRFGACVRVLQFKHAWAELTESWGTFWTVFAYRGIINLRAVVYVRVRWRRCRPCCAH